MSSQLLARPLFSFNILISQTCHVANIRKRLLIKYKVPRRNRNPILYTWKWEKLQLMTGMIWTEYYTHEHFRWNHQASEISSTDNERGQGSKTITSLITIGNGAPSALQEIVIFPPTGPRVSAGSGKRWKFGLNAETAEHTIILDR